MCKVTHRLSGSDHSTDEISKTRHSKRCTFETSRELTFTFKTSNSCPRSFLQPRAPAETYRTLSIFVPQTRIALSRKRDFDIEEKLTPSTWPHEWSRKQSSWVDSTWRTCDLISKSSWSEVLQQRSTHATSHETVDMRERTQQTSPDRRVHEINWRGDTRDRIYAADKRCTRARVITVKHVDGAFCVVLASLPSTNSFSRPLFSSCRERTHQRNEFLRRCFVRIKSESLSSPFRPTCFHWQQYPESSRASPCVNVSVRLKTTTR